MPYDQITLEKFLKATNFLEANAVFLFRVAQSHCY